MRKVLIFLLIFTTIFTLASCNADKSDNSDNNEENNVPLDGYYYEGTPTVGPYTVHDHEGNVYQAAADEEANPNVSMFHAIRLAGRKGYATRKSYKVVDANGTTVFEFSNVKDKLWCYDGTNVVGIKNDKEAVEWSKNRIKSYVVNCQGSTYYTLGTNFYEGSDTSSNIPLENFSGGYNYMFSKSGEMEGGEWTKLGFGYMEAYCRLSEATYRKSSDGSAWNAYIFINGAAGRSCDLGLIGNVNANNELVWALVRNCQHNDHKSTGDSFALPEGYSNPVTKMSYDAENDCYSGGDDLFFQCWQSVHGWTLKITNLKTNKEYIHEEFHNDVRDITDENGQTTQQTVPMFTDHEQYFRFLLAASYCPADDQQVWDGRCGAYLRNVVFDGVKVARYDASRDQESYKTGANPYTADLLEDFNPTSNMLYGYSQAADCSSAKYGTYSADGVYKSGNPYKAGDYYISYSCYYDGGYH